MRILRGCETCGCNYDWAGSFVKPPAVRFLDVLRVILSLYVRDISKGYKKKKKRRKEFE